MQPRTVCTNTLYRHLSCLPNHFAIESEREMKIWCVCVHRPKKIQFFRLPSISQRCQRFETRSARESWTEPGHLQLAKKNSCFGPATTVKLTECRFFRSTYAGLSWVGASMNINVPSIKPTMFGDPATFSKSFATSATSLGQRTY